jgi:hypothetical protein
MVMCFFNWVALNAQTVEKVNNLNSQMAITLAVEDEGAIQLQDWMLDFENGYLSVNEEPELRVEPWMFSFSSDYMAGSDESVISLEPWMVNFEQRCLVVENELDYPVESWMVSTITWECVPSILARK